MFMKYEKISKRATAFTVALSSTILASFRLV